MDVVSDVVSTMRTGAPHGSRQVHTSNWQVWFPPAPSAGFHAVRAGTCWLHLPSGPPVELSRDDVVFLPRGSGHGLTSSERPPRHTNHSWTPHIRFAYPSPGPRTTGTEPLELVCGAYGLDRTAHPLLDDLPAFTRVHLEGDPGLHAVIDALAAELSEERPGAPLATVALLEAAFVALVRRCLDAVEPGDVAARGWAAALADPVVGAALDAMHRNPGARWTVASLGRAGGASRAGFADRFARLVGEPPLRYLRWWRMLVAARLLRESPPDVALVSIAHRVGYASEEAFSRAFARHHGTPPGRYRKSGAATREKPSR